MSMMDTSDTDKPKENQEVTNPDVPFDAERQSRLADLIRQKEKHPVPDFKTQQVFRYLDPTKIIPTLKLTPNEAPAFSQGAKQLVKATSHIYSEPLSKLPNKQLLDS